MSNDRTEPGVCRPLEKRYRCPSCWQRFYFKPNLDYHMQRKHGAGQQPAQPLYDSLGRCINFRDVHPAQPGSGDVVPRSRYNAANKDWLDEKAAHEKTRQAAADEIDRLQSDLTAAQQRIADLKRLWEIDLTALTQVIAERDAAQQRIAELERELENERARGIHTCHDQCQRPLCVAQRRIAALEAWQQRAIATILELATNATKEPS